MYERITTRGLDKRGSRGGGLAALVLIALLLLPALPAWAHDASGYGNSDGGTTPFAGEAPIKMLRVGHTGAAAPLVRINIAVASSQGETGDSSSEGSDVIVGANGHIEVFSLRGELLYQSYEARIGTGDSHTFYLKRDDLRRRDLPDMPIFEPSAPYVDVSVKVVVASPTTASGNAQSSEGGVFLTTFELLDERTGESVLVIELPPTRICP